MPRIERRAFFRDSCFYSAMGRNESLTSAGIGKWRLEKGGFSCKGRVEWEKERKGMENKIEERILRNIYIYIYIYKKVKKM